MIIESDILYIVYNIPLSVCSEAEDKRGALKLHNAIFTTMVLIQIAMVIYMKEKSLKVYNEVTYSKSPSTRDKLPLLLCGSSVTFRR